VKKWIGLAVFFFGAVHANAELSCQARGGSYFLAKGDKTIGSEQLGFESLADCKKAKSQVKNDFVCSVAGTTKDSQLAYGPFDLATGRSTNGEGNYGNGATLDSCLNSVQNSTYGALCVWPDVPGSVWPKDRKYTIVNRFQEFMGYPMTWQECNASIHASQNGLYCSPANSRYYIFQKGKVYSTLSFPDLKSCLVKAESITNPPKLYTAAKDYTNLLVPFEQPVDEDIGFSLKKCKSSQFDYHVMPFADDGQLREECRPDTIYSWGDQVKLDWWQKNVGDQHPWAKNFQHVLYATTSPVGSFPYGPIPIRIKLKKDVNFKLIDARVTAYMIGPACGGLIPLSEVENTVVTLFWTNTDGRSGVDYILCSSGPIESWSFGQKLHYDEIVDDVLWAKGHLGMNYDLYQKKYGDTVPLFALGNIDGHIDSEPILRSELIQVQETAALGLGHIYYNLGVPHDPDEHFRTHIPTYYNPRAELNP